MGSWGQAGPSLTRRQGCRSQHRLPCVAGSSGYKSLLQVPKTHPRRLRVSGSGFTGESRVNKFPGDGGAGVGWGTPSRILPAWEEGLSCDL